MRRFPWLNSLLPLALLLLAGCGSAAQARQSHPLVFPTPTSGTSSTSGPKPGTTLLTYRGHHNIVTAVAWSPDGKRIASGSQTADYTSGIIQVWDASTGQTLQTYTGFQNSVTTLA